MSYVSKSEFKDIIEEAYFEVLKEGVLKTSTQKILGKFPTVKKTLIKLMTKSYGSFVEEIYWISPKPTTFKVELKNGNSFFLKWMKDDFQAQIEGNKYYLGDDQERQKSLDAITDLLKFNPIKPEEEEGFGSEEGFEGDDGDLGDLGGSGGSIGGSPEDSEGADNEEGEDDDEENVDNISFT